MKRRFGLTRHEFIHIVLPFMVPLFVFVLTFGIAAYVVLNQAGDSHAP